VSGLFTPRASEAPLLRYYANSIAHLLERPALTVDQELLAA
jgi:hypothetical protein